MRFGGNTGAAARVNGNLTLVIETSLCHKNIRYNANVGTKTYKFDSINFTVLIIKKIIQTAAFWF